jgi:hypothetical protein
VSGHTGVQENDFPSLAPLAPYLEGRPALPPKRIQHTQQSQRNPEIWARVQQAAARTSTGGRHVPGLPVRSTADSFPALPNAPKPAFASKTAWSASANAASLPKPAAPQVRSIAASQPKAPVNNMRPSNKSEFPDLPSSKAVAASRAAARDFFAPLESQGGGWGRRAEQSPTEETPPAASSVLNGKQKKKPKREVLFIHGMH